MLQSLWIIPALPFAGFVILALFGGRLTNRAIAAVGVGSVGLSALLSILVSSAFIFSPPVSGSFSQALWTWMQTAGFSPGMTLYLDAPAVIMMLVVSVVGFLIHLYSAGFMATDDGYRRFFACMNLFVGSMLVLVLAGDLLLLYLGWEGVGLCSWLLIGFWYRDPVNVRAANKAFIVTRIGDASLAVGLLVLFAHLGTLNIPVLLETIPQTWGAGHPIAVTAAALVLGGAVAKSAQLPLQVWLPDAMAGPTPVSALIHAATMVAAGVYLILRLHPLFAAAPAVQAAIAVIGVTTLLLAGFSALAQTDIKRALAWSTISQIGYMFLALGVGAWSAALFHFMTHAFFKALLFLSAGMVILAMKGEHDIFRMGGLRTRLPFVFGAFLIGAASLSALPLVTAGFYSKEMILTLSRMSAAGSAWLWAGALAGAFLTALYSFRLVFIVFFGSESGQPPARLKPAFSLGAPLIALAALSVLGGFVQMPHLLGGYSGFSALMDRNLPPVRGIAPGAWEEWFLFAAGILVPLTGIWTAWLFFFRKGAKADRLARSGKARALHRFWQTGWGFDRLYETALAGPFVQSARLNRDDFIDFIYHRLAGLSAALNGILVMSQSGRVRHYAVVLAGGALIMMIIVLLF